MLCQLPGKPHARGPVRSKRMSVCLGAREARPAFLSLPGVRARPVYGLRV